MTDLRYAIRMLLKTPGFTLAVLLMLAVGIGANTAIFSVVNTVLLRPLPYPASDRLVTLWERNPRRGLEQERVSGPNFMDWKKQNRAFDQIGFWSGGGEFNLAAADSVEKVKGIFAQSGLFPVLDVNPLRGRVFLPEEDRREGNRVAVIGYGLWQRRFGGDSNVLGRTLTIDTYGRRDYTIVGVMPPGFAFPDQSEIWLPFGGMGVRMDERRSAHWHHVVGRLKEGVTLARAQTEMDAIQASIAQQHPADLIGSEVAVIPLFEQTLGRNVRLGLLVLWGAIACVLLIACANVANLMLARAAARQKEFALRLALGASRWRTTRQLLAENLVLAALGALLGLFVGGLVPRGARRC